MVGIIQKKYGHIDFLQSKKTKQLGVWAPENFLFFGEKMEEKKNSVFRGESTTKDDTAIVFFELLSTFETFIVIFSIVILKSLQKQRIKKVNMSNKC